MDADAFETAGLYDPDAPHAAERLELLRWLLAQGLELEDLVEAARRGELTSAAGDRIVRPGERLTAAEVAARSGLDFATASKFRRAVGLAPLQPDDRVLTSGDVDLLAMLALAISFFGEPATLEFSRVLGSSLGRVAETAISIFLANVERPIKVERRGELALAQANLEACRALDMIPPAMDVLFREHVEEAIRRFRVSRSGTSFDAVHLAIGFVDLVGFTPLSQEIDAGTLARLVDDFEAAAFDLIAEHDGRVVKLIGDEVMFATVSSAAACEVALGLAETYAGEGTVAPRGAVAVGDVLARAGDYYGPVVNLASRAAALAVPNEVLTTREVRDETLAGPGSLAFEPAGRRILKGFADPVELFTVQRP